jgi:D-alanyl-D-alanine carboxypeptidase (penicillin-binding protein 5/6)
MKKLYRIISICLAIILLSNTVVFGEVNVNDKLKSALLGDLENGQVLYEYNVDEQLAIASITKLMTYLVMMDAVSGGKVSLDDDVLISGHAAATEGSHFGVLAGEKVKLSLLVKGMLIVSGNDCATAIAEHVGGSVDNFVKMMNEKASELGLMSASFINPNGLPLDDEETGQNHMSVSDLYKLVRHILVKYPQLLEITKQKELVVPERNFSKQATNPMLTVIEGVDGLKTGYTDKAGLCLVSTVPVKGKGEDFRLIAITMGIQTNEDRIAVAKELLEYGMNDFVYKKVIDSSQMIDQVYILNSKDGRVDVFAASDYNKIVKNGDVVKTKITYDESASAPFKKGDKIGTISIIVNDEEIGKVDAVVDRDIKKANIFVRIFRFLGRLFR